MGTPQPPAAPSGCKTPPLPVPLLTLPSSRGRREGSPQARSQRQVRDSGGGGPGSPPLVTCKDSDTDLMIVVSEDHSLGRHVSQRSHRTDRSREKPELRARRPGARSPWRAREREREVSGEGGGGSVGPSGLRPGEARPGARESAGGAESGRATPSPGRRLRAAGGRRGGRGRRTPGGVGARRERPRPLCGARDPGRLDGSRVRGKDSTS